MILGRKTLMMQAQRQSMEYGKGQCRQANIIGKVAIYLHTASQLFSDILANKKKKKSILKKIFDILNRPRHFMYLYNIIF